MTTGFYLSKPCTAKPLVVCVGGGRHFGSASRVLLYHGPEWLLVFLSFCSNQPVTGISAAGHWWPREPPQIIAHSSQGLGIMLSSTCSSAPTQRVLTNLSAHSARGTATAQLLLLMPEWEANLILLDQYSVALAHCCDVSDVSNNCSIIHWPWSKKHLCLLLVLHWTCQGNFAQPCVLKTIVAKASNEKAVVKACLNLLVLLALPYSLCVGVSLQHWFAKVSLSHWINP